MTVIKKIISFYKMSIYLDYLFLSSNLFSFHKRVIFIIKKYFIIFMHLFGIKKFEISKSRVNILDFNFYYDSQYGLAGLQGILSRHKRELEGIANKKVEIIFDIGANVGAFTILSHFLFKPKSIYSYEPVPEVYKCLKANTQSFNEVHTYNIAMSNISGISFMKFDEHNSSVSQLSDDGKGLKVETTTLKQIVEANKIKKIDLLKIDVESYENLVLDGCGDFLKNVRYLFIEVTIKDNKNYTISSLFSKLYGDGYDFQLLSFRNASDKSFGEVPWMDCLLENIAYKN